MFHLSSKRLLQFGGELYAFKLCVGVSLQSQRLTEELAHLFHNVVSGQVSAVHLHLKERNHSFEDNVNIFERRVKYPSMSNWNEVMDWLF